MKITDEIIQFAKDVTKEQYELYNDYHTYKSLEMPELKYQDFFDDAINVIRKRNG